MREHVSRAGRLIYYATRHELEALPGYRRTGPRARACCPIHAGDNPTALTIDWGTGWAHCYACGDGWAIRVEDHPDTKHPRESLPRPGRDQDQRRTKGVPKQNRNRTETDERQQTASGVTTNRPQTAYRDATIVPGRTEPPQRATATPAPNAAALERLQSLAALWADAYAGSPAAAYVRARGIPDDVAGSLGWGYVTDNPYLRSHRLFIPYTDPNGQLSGGAGRALDGTTHPKYLTLRNRDGFRKTLVNGGAIAQARAARMPLVIVEGPFDAAACIAGGLPLVIALNGVVARPEWFAGIPRVFLANDADDAGREAVARFRRTVPVHVSHFDDDDLARCKDVAGYWEHHGRLPAGLLMGVAAEMVQNGTENERATLLVDELKEEAKALGLELAFDPEDLARFMDDLRRHEQVLSTEDRAAARYAIRYAQSLVDDAPEQRSA